MTSPSASCHSCTGALLTVVPLVEFRSDSSADLAVPADLQVPTRHPGVGQPELRVLAAADHVGALAQLVGAAAAVIELQRDGRSGCRVLGLAAGGA